MLWRERDGKTSRVFEDRWLPGQNPSKVISPWTSIDDDWTVSQLIDQDMGWWNSSIIDALFLPFEAQKIKGIPLCVSNQEDCIVWPRCKSRLYFVKMGYQLLCKKQTNEVATSSNDTSSRLFWGHIWKLRVPNKVNIFLWRAFANKADPTETKSARQSKL